MSRTIANKQARHLTPDFQKLGVKILNVPLYVQEDQLKFELNRLFDNSIISLDIQLDPADNSLGVVFARFNTIEAKNNCLNLAEEKKFVFSKENLWQGPLIFEPYTNFIQIEQQYDLFMTDDSAANEIANKIGQLFIEANNQVDLKQKLELLKELEQHKQQLEYHRNQMDQTQEKIEQIAKKLRKS